MFCLVALGSGQRCATVPATNPATVVVSGGVKANELGNQAKNLTPEAITKDDSEQQKRLSKVAASLGAMELAKPAVQDGLGKDAVFVEKDLAASQLQEVVINPADFAEASNRVTLRLQGKLVEAEQARIAAMSAADQAKLERDAARKERDAAISTQQRLVDEAAKEREEAAKVYASRLKTLENEVLAARRERDAAVDNARKERDDLLSKVILAISSLCFLAGAALLILTRGTELVRGGLALACGAIGFGCYWTLNRPWFKYVAGSAVFVVIIGIAALVIYEWREKRKKLETDKELKDYDEVWDASKKLVAVIDTWKTQVPESVSAPLLQQLKGVMDKDHRDIIHELRFESETGKAIKT